MKIVFGDWGNIGPILEKNADKFAQIHIENAARNSAIPLLDMKEISARIEPGAIIREQVEIGENAVIMMGAILNIGAVVGAVSNTHLDVYKRQAPTRRIPQMRPAQ